MRQVTFYYQDTAKSINYTKKRSGKPREHWTETALEKTWKQFRHEAPKMNSRRPEKRQKYKESGRLVDN